MAAPPAGKLDTYILSAWKRLISDPPDTLTQLIVEDIKKHHKLSADPDAVARFITTYIALSEPQKRQPRQSRRKIDSLPVSVAVMGYGKFKGTRPISFQIGNNKEQYVESWKDLLMKMCAEIANDNPDCFEKAVQHIKGRKNRVYFAKDGERSQDRRRVQGTDVYVETKLSANNIKSLCDVLSKRFDYGPKLKVQIL